MAIVHSNVVVLIANDAKAEPSVQRISAGTFSSDKCAIQKYLISAHALGHYCHGCVPLCGRCCCRGKNLSRWIGWNWLRVGCIVARNINDYRITYLTANNEEQYMLSYGICIEVHLIISWVEVVRYSYTTFHQDVSRRCYHYRQLMMSLLTTGLILVELWHTESSWKSPSIHSELPPVYVA